MEMFEWLQRKGPATKAEEQRVGFQEFTESVKEYSDPFPDLTLEELQAKFNEDLEKLKSGLNAPRPIPPRDPRVDQKIEMILTKENVPGWTRSTIAQDMRQFYFDWHSYVTENPPAHGTEVDPPDLTCRLWISAWLSVPRPVTQGNYDQASQPASGWHAAYSYFFTKDLETIEPEIRRIQAEQGHQIEALLVPLRAVLDKPIDYGAAPDSNSTILLQSLLAELAKDSRSAGFGEDIVLNIASVARYFWSKYYGLAAPTATLCVRARYQTVTAMLEQLARLNDADKTWFFTVEPNPPNTLEIVDLACSAFNNVNMLNCTEGVVSAANKLITDGLINDNIGPVMKKARRTFEFNDQEKCVLKLAELVVEKLP